MENLHEALIAALMVASGNGSSGGGGGGGESTIAWKPTVSADGKISWTRTSSTTKPADQNIKGDKGDKGDQGVQGEQGAQGERGEKGADGAPGADGFSPQITITDITGGHRVTIIDADHPQGQSFDVMDGQDGGGGSGNEFIAEYGVTTAQEIIAFLDSADPKAPMAVKRGNDYYTVITTSKQAANKVIIRTFDTLSGVFYIFTYTITNGTWANANYGLQQALVSGTNIKTINGQSILTPGDILIPENDYEVCKNDVGGNIIQVGSITKGGVTYGLYQFYLETGELPNATTAVYSFATLAADYTIVSFIDATGVTSDGIFIGNGRTDNDNRLIVQQFSKNSKTVTIRTYKDFTGKTALLKILFYGTKA